MAQFKIPVGRGTPPYSAVVKNFAGVTVHTITGALSDELEVPDAIMNAMSGGIDYTVTDSNGKTGRRRIDNGSLRCMKRLMIGFSVSNGDTSNHVAKITEGEARGFSFTGIIMEASEIQNDSQLLALEASGKFNWVPSLPSTPVYHMDRTIWTLKRQNICNQIRWNNWWQRNLSRGNNGSTITLFLNPSDAMMRADGVTPVIRESGNSITDKIVPSYAAENTFTYASRIQLAVAKRYVDYLNAADIIAMGSILTDNGEGELNFQYKAGGTDETYLGSNNTHGDFHPESMAKFRAKFPEHNGSDNFAIAMASRSSQLGIDWRWHCNQIIIDFEFRMAKHLKDNLPELSRTAFYQMDSGSFVDELAFYRSTLNITERAKNPYAFLYKSNDDSDVSADKLAFYLDQISTAAHMNAGIAIVEPSPVFPYEDPSHYFYIVAEMQQAALRGIGTSLYSQNGSYNSTLVSGAGLTPGSVPKGKNDYIITGGQKRKIFHEIPLSQVLSGGGFGGSQAWKNSHAAFKALHELTHVDTRTIDDVKPNLGA